MGQVIRASFWVSKWNREKSLHIYLPEIAEMPLSGFPVLFMHDGHNLFDPETSAFGSTWKVKETLEAWEKTSGIGIIVVGIDCPSIHRFDQYSPWPNADPEHLPPAFRIGRRLGGEGETYAEWIVSELKPWIQSHFPVDSSRTWMAGSSMGAVISLYTAFRFPGAIQKIGVFSPAVWFAEEELLAFLRNHENSEIGVWLDVGTEETSDSQNPAFPEIYLSGARKIHEIFTGVRIRDLRYREIPGGIHHETAWAERFPEFIRWLSTMN
ncbi:MAG TPA: alpha/beta hydrolase-fold protein [Bacillota bacterium]|nr:alpha/beta hydrolase-fold protein [Bacillota bacterium]